MAFGTATVFTNKGRDIVTNRIIGAGTEPKFIALGTGATGAARTAVVADTALSTELTEGRATGTSSRVTTSVTNDTYQTVGTVTASGSRAVDEAGTFDVITTSSGNMGISATFPVVNLLLGDSLQITAKVVFA
jgi:hypothetical protein